MLDTLFHLLFNSILDTGMFPIPGMLPNFKKEDKPYPNKSIMSLGNLLLNVNVVRSKSCYIKIPSGFYTWPSDYWYPCIYVLSLSLKYFRIWKHRFFMMHILTVGSVDSTKIQKEVHRNMFKVLKNTCENMHGNVRTDAFQTSIGVRQGCMWSQLLFIFVIKQLATNLDKSATNAGSHNLNIEKGKGWENVLRGEKLCNYCSYTLNTSNVKNEKQVCLLVCLTATTRIQIFEESKITYV